MEQENESENVESTAKQNTCTICHHTFADSDQLERHFLSFHPNVKFCCYVCHLAYSETESLFNHMKMHGVIKPNKSRIALFDQSRHVLARIGYLEEAQISPEVTAFWERAYKKKPPKPAKPPKRPKPPKPPKAVKQPKTTRKRKYPSGSQRCCVTGCKSTCETVPKVSFFCFPTKDIQKRLLWIAILNKKNKDGTEWKPNPSDRICSKHFVSGKHSPTQNNIDYTPTIGVGLDEKTIADFVAAVIKEDVRYL